MIPGLYEDQLKDMFVKFHKSVNATARANFLDRGRLTRTLIHSMAKGMRDLNPPCKEYIDLEALDTEDDIECQNTSASSYFFGSGQEIELTSL